MMHRLSITTAVVALATAVAAIEPAPMPKAVGGPVTFVELVKSVAADLSRLRPEDAADTRYLDARNAMAAKSFHGVIAYHVNGMSREFKLVAPREVAPWLWAVRLSDYRWSAKAWDELATKNVYYTIKATVTVPGEPVVKTRQVVKTDGYNRQYYTTEQYTEPGKDITKEDVVSGPWLPLSEMQSITSLTSSKTPIVRADQFLFLTAIQVDRKGHGYYDFLELTKRADVEELAGLDRKKAEKLYRELAEIIPVSGVAPNNRQIFRYNTLVGGWWETRDTKKSTDTSNAITHLLEDFKHDAEEIVFTLPNRLPGYYLSDDKGKQQDTAPDFIASDGRSTNNDRRVHVGYSCIACHTDGGLKPIKGYARSIYAPDTGVKLGSLAVDADRSKRLESVYLGPLGKAYTRDVGDFGEAIEEISGLKSADLAKQYEAAWSRYLDEPVTLEKAAVECGVTADEFRLRLKAHAAKKVVDPVLAVYMIPDPPPVRREHFEERFAILMLILGGLSP